MEILLLRTALAPSLILLVSVVARRSGPRLGGLLLGAPTTSGPFLALMWLDGGSDAAARAAHGNIAAQLAVVSFCLAYGRLAPALRPAWSLTAALVCASGAGLVAAVCASVWLTAALTLVVICLGLRTWPAPAHTEPAPARAPSWEIPVRMAVSATTVLFAVNAADTLGSFTGGILAAFPVLLAVIAPSVHRSTGADAAAAMMRAALTVAPGTVAFLLVLHTAFAAAGAQ
ncbi:hypothetical protein EJ357_02130 [Streptomyces cyaneochromogenes]|uniref:Uncharacterized protein n=1 Tax=Streptomyces cyaneochromogenes TaxID=2496836 RepID=A0A3S9LZM9_9ACTN|nr:hypothetical protein [Streptomyces cyaneochromogenes]AZQ32394.1 hypothetical protein EJ357_02130 [Streptomyces cyaneochromogenes]